MILSTTDAVHENGESALEEKVMSWIDDAFEKETALEATAKDRLLNQVKPWWGSLRQTLEEDVNLFATKKNVFGRFGVTKSTEASIAFGPTAIPDEPFVVITLNTAESRLDITYYTYPTRNTTNINNQQVELQGKSFTDEEIPELSREILMPCLFPHLYRRERAAELGQLAEGLRSKVSTAGLHIIS